MEMRQVMVKNFHHLVSYNRFNSCEDNDDKDEDALGNQSFRNINSGGVSSGSRYYGPAVVCLTLLCFLLISAVSVVWVKFNNLTTKNTELQTQNSKLILKKDQLETSYKNLTLERNQLQTVYNNLNRDKDQLQTSNNKLTVERDRLQTSNNNLTVERDRVQTSYNKLTVDRDRLQTSFNNLTVERDRLQTSFNNLTVERDRLQTSFNNLTVERDRLQTSFNNLTVERDRVQTSYNNLTVERDRLQTGFNNLTVERDRLQTSFNNLTMVRDQDQAKCQELSKEREKLYTNYSIIANQKDQLQKERDQLQNHLEELGAQAKLGWVYFSFSLYFISTEKKSWNEGRQDCKQKQAELVVIKTEEEQKFLVKQLGSDKAWIGLNDKNTEGTWKWVDGTALRTEFWVPGEPNNSGNEDCAELWGFPDKNGWNDRPCSGRVRWICEKPSQW